jgi:hypothetical protein
MKEKITIKGAREHNLKNIDIEIPRAAFFGRLVFIDGSRVPLLLRTLRLTRLKKHGPKNHINLI